MGDPFIRVTNTGKATSAVTVFIMASRLSCAVTWVTESWALKVWVAHSALPVLRSAMKIVPMKTTSVSS